MKIKKITFILIFSIIINHLIFTNASDRKLNKAGITEKQAKVGDIVFNYAESPDNGPALLMLHAQTLDWYSYNKVLPSLSKKFHVFALDYQSHGKTIIPNDYEMSANQIGSDICLFIEEIIGEQVFVTGNSSGGLLSVWLAANRGDLIKAIVLEDPPLFSSEYSQLNKTVADKLFTSSYQAVQDGQTDDYLNYWIDHSANFFKTYTGSKGSQKIIKSMVNNYKKKNPDKPIDLPFLPAAVKEMIRGMDYYNPRFGAAFHDGSWNKDFDHAEALKKIQCPTLLIQADFDYLDDGTLNGAMSKEMADKVVSLTKNCEYIKVKSGHVTNLEIPKKFIRILEDFFLQKNKEGKL